jgi:hypothetical protein
MNAVKEIVGWVSLSADSEQVLVRDEEGNVHAQALEAEDKAFESQAIQTGAFRRARPIFDKITREILGYELERLFGAPAAG